MDPVRMKTTARRLTVLSSSLELGAHWQLGPKELLLDLLGDGFRLLPSYSRCLRFLREGGPRITRSFLDGVT